ncbi:MAG: rhamnulokinase [Clostridia bacterium]|nr:rhamnulokinase [Clostridia bacterium]
MLEYFLAIDIGASSGRHIVGRWDGDKIETDEVYRFPTGVCRKDGCLEWDIDRLFECVVLGIREAFTKHPGIKCLAIDTWAVDYVLMDAENRPIKPCYAYRDLRTEKVIDEVHSIVPFETLYKKTGIQFQPFNTIYQLYADKKAGRLDKAASLLMLPEYLVYRLTGERRREYTNATATGLLSTETGDYDRDITDALGLPERFFETPVAPGTPAGTLKKGIAEYVGGNCRVAMCATHDTASSVEGMDIEGDNPYISSGTWSLLGLKVPRAITTDESLKANFTNEGGVGYIRYQKNIMGMWIINELKRDICPFLSFPEIVALAKASSFEETVDVNSETFLSPQNMKKAFDDTLTQKPSCVGDYFRCATLSLAQGYKKALEELSANTGKTFDRLFIYGGGAKNTLLNEMTQDVCGIQVVPRPVEASALGNLKVQMRAYYRNRR